MEKRDFKEYIYMGMTAVSVIAVCILLWFSIQHWDVVSAGTRKVVKILAPILCGAVLTYLTAPAYNWVAGIVEKTLGSVTKNSNTSAVQPGCLRRQPVWGWLLCLW